MNPFLFLLTNFKKQLNSILDSQSICNLQAIKNKEKNLLTSRSDANFLLQRSHFFLSSD